MSQQIHKHLVRKSFGKRLFSYTQHAVIQASMAEDLVWQLHTVHPEGFERVLEVGCGSGTLTAAFLKRFQTDVMFTNDIVEACGREVELVVKQYPGTGFHFLGGDIEQITELPGNLDVIISNATLQWLTDLPAFLQKIRRALRPGGLLAFSTFGPQNLQEIRHLTGVGLAYWPYQQLRKLLEEHFDVLWCEESVVPLLFSSPRSVLRHMRLTGVNGVAKRRWTKSGLQQFEQQYWEAFGANDQVPLTYHPILCIVRVQHADHCDNGH